jgi:hypothetical protein
MLLKVVAWFGTKDRWSILRNYGNSPIVRLTVLIPIIGWLLLFNDYLVKHLQVLLSVFGGRVEVLVDGEKHYISGRLIQLYIGLVLTSIGALFYSIWCPEQIKRYTSPPDYIKGEFNSISIRERRQIERLLEVAGDRIVAELNSLRWRLHLDADGIRQSRAQAFDNQGREMEEYARMANYFNGILDLHYEVLDTSYRFARWLAAIFYCAGLAFFAWLTFGNVASIAWLWWHHS